MNDYFSTNLNNNIPTPPKVGVYNDFISPISGGENDDQNISTKKDSVRGFLVASLILTILLAIGAFFYTKLLQEQVNSYRASLFEYDNSQSVSTFENNLGEMRILSQKLKLINNVYNSKIYIASMLFPALESVTESSPTSYVYFNNFSLKKGNTENISTVSMSGVAVDYLSLYRQINNFKNNPLFKNFKFASFSVDEKGNLNFSISFDVDISTNSYLKFLNGEIANITASSTNTRTGSGPLFRNLVPVDVIPQNSTTSSSTNINATNTNKTTN